MCNLEELALLIGVVRLRRNDFVDGKHLESDFLMDLPRLRKFRFSIHTSLFGRDPFVDHPSNVDVQRTFNRNIFGHVGSYVEHYPERTHSTCHVYSLPYAFKFITRLSQSFPGGAFSRVQRCAIAGLKPLGRDFFVKVAKSFPYLEHLILCNLVSPRDQQTQSNNIAMPIIVFPQLKSLYLHDSHVDYVEQLISDASTSLPSLSELYADYGTLSVLTNNFINELARRNCANVQVLGVNECIVPYESFFSYFPSLVTLEKWMKLMWSKRETTTENNGFHRTQNRQMKYRDK